MNYFYSRLNSIVIHGLANNTPALLAGYRYRRGSQLGIEIILGADRAARGAGGARHIEHLAGVFFQQRFVSAGAGNVREGKWPTDAGAGLSDGAGGVVEGEEKGCDGESHGYLICGECF